MKLQLETPTLLLFESALFRTVSTLIVGADHLLLADPTWLPGEVESIADRVSTLAAGRELFVLFTHADYDHIIGYGRFPDARTIASRAFAENPSPEEPLQQIRAFDDAYYITRDYPLAYPTITWPIAGDGITRQLGSEEYVFYQAPGHNPDGLITFNVAKGILIVGDYLSNIEFPYVYDSVARYRETLAKLEGIVRGGRVRMLVTGHGDHTGDPTEMLRRIADSHAYLDALEQSVREDTPFDLDELFRRYAFPGIMAKFHAGNVATFRRELSCP